MAPEKDLCGQVICWVHEGRKPPAKVYPGDGECPMWLPNNKCLLPLNKGESLRFRGVFYPSGPKKRELHPHETHLQSAYLAQGLEFLVKVTRI